MRIVSWLLRAFIFFTLFAFALNNRHPVHVHWFFGLEWRAQMVFVVLAAFSVGCAVGVLSMLPGWWRQRSRAAAQAAAAATQAPANPSMSGALPPSSVGSASVAAAPDKPTVDGHPPMLGV